MEYSSFRMMLDSDLSLDEKALEEFVRGFTQMENSSEERRKEPKSEESTAKPCPSASRRSRSPIRNMSTEQSPNEPSSPDSTRQRRRRKKGQEKSDDTGRDVADISHRRRRRERDMAEETSECVLNNKITVLEGKGAGRGARGGAFQCICPRCQSSSTVCIPIFHSEGGSLTHCQRPPDPPGEGLVVPQCHYVISPLRSLSVSRQAGPALGQNERAVKGRGLDRDCPCSPQPTASVACSGVVAVYTKF